MLKDGVNGVDGFAYNATLSADGKHAHATGAYINPIVWEGGVSWYERNASTGALSYGGVLKNGWRGLWRDARRIRNHAHATGANDDAISWYERNASTGSGLSEEY